MPSIAISRPHWKTASAILMAGAVLFAANAAHADPRHGGHDRGGYSHDRGRGYDHNNRGHGRHYTTSRNSFSLSIGSYYPRPYYQPYYPATYYAPPPVAYPQPVVYTQPAQPVNYNYYNNNDGRYCREYTKQVWVGGRMQQGYGSACLQPDGDWEVES